MTLKIGRFQLQTQRIYGVPLTLFAFCPWEVMTDIEGDTFGWCCLSILCHQIRVFYDIDVQDTHR